MRRLLPALALLCLAQTAPAQPDPSPAPTSAAALPSAAAPAPARTYAIQPFLSHPLLSPDGRRIAALIRDGGPDRLGIWQVGASAGEQPLTVPVTWMESFRWAGNDRLLITRLVLVALAGDGVFYIGPARRVFSHDISAGKTTALGGGTGAFESVIHVDPEARYVLLSKQQEIDDAPSVHRVDLATAESSLVEPSRRGVWSWHADQAGVVRVGVDYGERRTRIYYRDAAGQPLRLVQPRRNLSDNSSIDQVRFLAGGSRGLIVTNAQTGRFGVYEYDFAQDVLGAALFEHPEVDVDEMIIGVDGALAGIAYHDDRPRTRWLDPEMEALQATADRTFPGRTNQIVNRSGDGNRALIWSSAPHDAGTYYVFDRPTRRMEIFASPYDQLLELAHSETRPVRYRSRDGTNINGYLTLPRGRGERGLPLVVLPHGGPFIRDQWVFDPEVQFLASRGYAVLQANFAGSTGYGRAFVERGFGQLGGRMIDDVEDGIDWLAREGIADPARVCIMGSSYGGYAAIWAAIRSPQRYRCAISFAGPSDLRTMLRHTARGFTARRYFRNFERQVKGEADLDLNTISPWRQAARLRVPALIAHGKKDAIVPVRQSEQLIEALTRARAREVQSVIYDKSGHSFEEVDEREDYLKRVEAFLARHNPA